MVRDNTTSMHVLPIECKQFSFLKVGHTLGYGFLMLFVIHYVLYRITRERIDTANETKWKFGPFCWFVFSTVGWPGSQRQCLKIISMTCADTEMGTTTIFERVETDMEMHHLQYKSTTDAQEDRYMIHIPAPTNHTPVVTRCFSENPWRSYLTNPPVPTNQYIYQPLHHLRLLRSAPPVLAEFPDFLSPKEVRKCRRSPHLIHGRSRWRLFKKGASKKDGVPIMEPFLFMLLSHILKMHVFLGHLNKPKGGHHYFQFVEEYSERRMKRGISGCAGHDVRRQSNFSILYHQGKV